MPKNKHSKHVLHVITLLTFISIPIWAFTSQASTTPTVYVEPPSTTQQTGASFTTNISIAKVTDLCSWEFRLYFKNEILSATNHAEGPFLKSHGPTFLWVVDFTDNYNSTHGRVWLACVRLWNGTGIDGNGTLAIITFLGVGGGNTTLHLTNTVLGNSQAKPIQHTTTDGTVEVLPGVTIMDVTPFAPIAGQGIPFPINVTTLNEGNQPAIFDLTIYFNSTPIETKHITQPGETSLTTTFFCDTTGLNRYQNYIISASTGHGTFIDSTIKIVIPGDVDVDKDVDLYDAVRLLKAYGAKKGNPSYDPNCDIDCDGSIILYDAVTLLRHYGEKEP